MDIHLQAPELFHIHQLFFLLLKTAADIDLSAEPDVDSFYPDNFPSNN